jgi:hypothetical protein
MKYFILICCFILNFSQTQADVTPEKTKEVKSVEEYTEDDFELVKTQRLKRIRRELVGLNSEINTINKQLKNEDIGMMTRIQNEAKLNNLAAEYKKKKDLFIETVTNINLNHDNKKKIKTTFSDDLKQILDPALSTFKAISDKPRQIQQLSQEMESLQSRYADAVNAKKRLDIFQK